MQQPTGAAAAVATGTGSSENWNRNLLVGIGLAGIAAAGVALAVWASSSKVKRTKKTQTRTTTKTKKDTPLTSSGSKPQSSKKGSDAGLSFGQNARVTLHMLSEMDAKQLQIEVERANREEDKASLINILFFFATNLTSTTPITPERLQEAANYYLGALEMAKEIGSDMQGVIQVELAVIFFIFGDMPSAIERFEAGLPTYLLPGEEGLDTKILLRYFVMLTDAYLKTERYDQGIAFLQNFISQLKKREDGETMLGHLLLSVGEFYYAKQEYTTCIKELENAASYFAMNPDILQLSHYYLGWAYYKSQNWQKAVENYSRYLELAKESNTPPESTIESVASMVDCYRQLKDEENMNASFEKALQILNTVDSVKHPLIALKHFYFLGLFCYNKLEQLERAKTLLKKALQLARTDEAREKDIPWANIATELGEVYHKLKKRQKALEVLTMATTGWKAKEEALVPPVLLRIARIHSEMGHKATALQVLQSALDRCLKIKKDARAEMKKQAAWMEAFLRYQLGKMYTLMGQLTQGEEYLRASLSGFVEDDLEMRTIIQASISSNIAQAGKREEALNLLQEVIELTGTETLKKAQGQSELATELGEVYFFLDMFNQSKKLLEEAVTASQKEKNDRSELAAQVRLYFLRTWLGELSSNSRLLELVGAAAKNDQSYTQLGAVAATALADALLMGNITEALTYIDECQTYLDPDCCGRTPLNVFSFYTWAMETFLWAEKEEQLVLYQAKILEYLSNVKGFAKQNVSSLLYCYPRLATVSLHLEDEKKDPIILNKLEEMLAVARAHGSKRNQAEISVLVAHFKLRSSKVGDSSLVAEGLASAEEFADARTLGFVNWLAGLFYLRVGEYEKAQKCLQQALDSSREVGDALTQSLALRDLAIVALKTGDLEKSNELLNLSLELAKQKGNVRLERHLPHALTNAQTSIPVIQPVSHLPSSQTAPQGTSASQEAVFQAASSSSVPTLAEVAPEATPEVVSDAAPEATPEAIPEAIPEAVPEATPEVVPEATPEATPQLSEGTAPEGSSETASTEATTTLEDAPKPSEAEPLVETTTPVPTEQTQSLEAATTEVPSKEDTNNGEQTADAPIEVQQEQEKPQSTSEGVTIEDGTEEDENI